MSKQDLVHLTDTDSRSAEKVTPAAESGGLKKFEENVQWIAGEFERRQKRIATLEAALEECLEYFKDKYDVVDGSYGEPSPNKEMQLGSVITEALYGPGVV